MGLRLLIVDDSPRFLKAARTFLELEGIAVVGVASTIAEALERVQELRPEVALVDIDLGDESGFELTRCLASHRGRTPSSLILISSRAEEDYGDLIEASPAIGFLSKSDLSATAIYEVLGGNGGPGPPAGA